MTECVIDFCGERCVALGSGGAWFPAHGTLVVSDLHLGKSERMARRGGAMLPPYECAETLERLGKDIARTGPSCVICLGDSFDDDAAAEALGPDAHARITAFQQGREWVWISGNHDPAPHRFGGAAASQVALGRLLLRHIAEDGAAPGEVSGHYHPKAQLSLHRGRVSRPCFLFDAVRMILPAYGTYTGGLDWCAAPLRALFPSQAFAVLTGPAPCMVPRPARTAARRAS
ncbi:ligase-associated DNA damage response endonuclease PdeM [Profundibacterium mesophilum]|uniref:Metallo-phosphoesterase n=1 Tax=Profundibacterium mesophilum KAUST100406-0324 TaxID=1037889 RepID=A0A921NUE0_9RHOB|nr:ligase-associated DNA damage response endonuclease PdeM [Profundibacterium mesophilum]KAF0675753.1 putative metallo-phosphoesterase [Profundibacterium mesophilum KAUST100406-0324]